MREIWKFWNTWNLSLGTNTFKSLSCLVLVALFKCTTFHVAAVVASPATGGTSLVVGILIGVFRQSTRLVVAQVGAAATAHWWTLWILNALWGTGGHLTRWWTFQGCKGSREGSFIVQCWLNIPSDVVPRKDFTCTAKRMAKDKTTIFMLFARSPF